MGADDTAFPRSPHHRGPEAADDRPPLRPAALERALVRPGGLWRTITVVPAMASTNTALLEHARQGEPEGAVLVTEHQTAGRGRLDRGFTTPPRAALTLSALVRPRVPAARVGWLSLLMGVAAVAAVERAAGVATALKWPNDLLSRDGEHKLAGILAEAAFPAPDGGGAADPPGIVIGIGLNVAQRREELPVETATSLALCGAPGTDRDALLRALLEEFAERYAAWAAAGGDAEAAGLAEEYRRHCLTVGRAVRVHLPGDRRAEGRAVGVDAEGRLVVRTETGREQALSAGDVVHVRPGGTAG
ncbi:biotin--[acetyl-CoA-carboxylase] ligase [Streptomonospora nanhaiensis]|uniref:biotin--[biotin carboxyl-carrier protein] ligase n=1 Tax=Streptomonospora nanhaiensis TaxID=1323731 RepID=A0A853BRS0_9ACTN|nr:biotin--[acetyl-CoA-carboxylase] ligase [Streptomonospora nanhaiensis]MBV2366063.1 biotin--[acetyl-CoA-carboxylase] ligase [Streptomonospora nanhaiensis]MBX9389752.1 biotin--[acetyl-CoA-carboxylase] ligase [Streptomonospora nanhaiensis]NYI97680.1 BirA family biotin operon repressor/biotin-[acetyl-CoA-carboxylase] ligase [Streptomonospora nanhaiensis]